MRFVIWGGGLAAAAGLFWTATTPREGAAAVPPASVARAERATPPLPVETAEPPLAPQAFGPGVLIPATFLLPAAADEAAPMPREVRETAPMPRLVGGR